VNPLHKEKFNSPGIYRKSKFLCASNRKPESHRTTPHYFSELFIGQADKNQEIYS
jgi:hypothetical protein